MSKDSNRNRYAWEKQVWADHKLAISYRGLLVLIGRTFVNWRWCGASVPNKAVTWRCGVKESMVKRTIEAGKRRGHIEAEFNRHQGCRILRCIIKGHRKAELEPITVTRVAAMPVPVSDGDVPF